MARPQVIRFLHVWAEEGDGVAGPETQHRGSAHAAQALGSEVLLEKHVRLAEMDVWCHGHVHGEHLIAERRTGRAEVPAVTREGSDAPPSSSSPSRAA